MYMIYSDYAILYNRVSGQLGETATVKLCYCRKQSSQDKEQRYVCVQERYNKHLSHCKKKDDMRGYVR